MDINFHDFEFIMKILTLVITSCNNYYQNSNLVSANTFNLQ